MYTKSKKQICHYKLGERHSYKRSKLKKIVCQNYLSGDTFFIVLQYIFVYHQTLDVAKRPIIIYKITASKIVDFQDPIINIANLKEIHSEINLTVPDPILLSNLQDGLEAVSLHFRE